MIENRVLALALALADPRETSLGNLEQLTFAGDNGEAYFSPDGRRLIFQSKREGREWDQIYTMRVDGSGQKMISSGSGRTTCAYWSADGMRIIYSSTHLRPETPPRPQGGHGYEWFFDPAFEIFSALPDGSDLVQLTSNDAYDAEGTFAVGRERIVFTSARDGDLEIYSMNADGTDVERLTHAPGYDGGAFFSPDGRKIVYRASRTDDYRALQIYIMNADGTDPVQLTHGRGTSFAPSFHPGGEHIVFSSNMEEPGNFELYLMRVDGSEMTRLTYHPAFDGFPMFSPDGRRLVFASNRAAGEEGQTHIFIADFTKP
jgi:Tol biopolymer transport system component